MESIKVTIDNSADDVVKWDKEGKELQFDVRKGKFLLLTDEQVGSLSYRTKQIYLALKQFNQTADEPVDDEEAELQQLVQSSNGVINASEKMKVTETDPSERGLYEYALVNVGEDVDHKRAIGWSPVRGSQAASGLNRTGAGLHKFSSRGQVQQILMRISKVEFERQRLESHKGLKKLNDQINGKNNQIVTPDGEVVGTVD